MMINTKAVKRGTKIGGGNRKRQPISLISGNKTKTEAATTRGVFKWKTRDIV